MSIRLAIRVTPDDHFVDWQQDPFGNHLARFVFPEPTRELAVTVSLVADMTVINPFDFFVDEDARRWPFSPANADTPAEDSTDLHAWAEAYIPGAGWLGLDPTSGLLTGEGHIPLACTSLPAAAMPIAGTMEPAGTTFEHANVVRRIDEDADVTLPYTAEQWERIDALGRAIDADLEAGDTRLTTGGEPTFVSSADIEKPEWSTAAVGGRTEELATRLAERLAGHFAPGALIHHGQGKWYPGEALPRWQIGIYWRADGHPLWRDPELLADPTGPREAHRRRRLARMAVGPRA